MAYASTIVTDRFPRFAGDTRLTVALADAAAALDSSGLGTRLEEGVALLAAHYLASESEDATAAAAAGGVSGPVTSRTAGMLSESYATGAASAGGILPAGDLHTTIYGRRLLRLFASRAVCSPGVY